MTNLLPDQANDQTSPQEQAKFTIIGAGVIGLLTAQTLAEQGHDVTVLAHEGKPTAYTHTASVNAIGQFLPWVPPEHAATVLGDLSLEEVTGFSRKFYEDLAQNPHETGVMPIRNIEFVRSEDPWPTGLQDAMQATETTLTKPIIFPEPTGKEVPFDTEIAFNTLSINARKTIPYLAEHAEGMGVKFEKRAITPEELEGLEGIIINASGVGAHKLDPSQIVKHFKGHTFVLKPKEGHNAPSEALSIDDLIIMPREDGTVICGALYINDPERPVPEKVEADELFDRLGRVIHEAVGKVEGLEPDLLDQSEVLVHSAAYRVEADGSSIKVAPDENNERLLHAYGFGGIGWSVGPHFAKEISKLALEMHQNLRRNREG